MTRAGAKPIYTDAIAEEIIAGIATGLTDKDAAAAAGISEDTFGRWMKGRSGAGADFADRVTRTRRQRARLWLGGIGKIAKESKDWRAYAELLDRCAPEYRKVHKTEQTITVEVRAAAEKVAAELGLPVDVVLAETFRMAEGDGS